jgi:hypothetical protein
MIYRIFFILWLILISCKKEDENKPYDITITGIVTDQVTGQPVEGATVSLGNQLVSYPEEGLMAPEQSTLTEPDGRYKLITSAVPYNTGSVSPGTYQRNTIALIASKSGYIGSDRREMHYYGAHNSELDLRLYHSSELEVHIKNDTTNSIDTVDIKLVKPTNSNNIVVLKLVCNKRKLDSTYVLKNLYGNWEYSIWVLKPGGQPLSPAISYSITPKPDTINSLYISF